MDLTAQDSQLMPEHDDLNILRRSRSEQKNDVSRTRRPAPSGRAAGGLTHARHKQLLKRDSQQLADVFSTAIKRVSLSAGDSPNEFTKLVGRIGPGRL
jgi:hypothetical protein